MTAFAAFGTLLQIGDGATPTEHFTTVAEVTSIDGPGFKQDVKDVTSHTAAGGFRQKIATLRDAGQVKIDVNFLPGDATQDYSTGVLKDFVNGTLRNYQLVFPAAVGKTWAYSAYVTQFEPKMPVDGQISASITYDISGQPTLS